MICRDLHRKSSPHLHCGISKPVKFFQCSSSDFVIIDFGHHIFFPVIENITEFIDWVFISIRIIAPGCKIREHRIHPTPDKTIIVSGITDSRRSHNSDTSTTRMPDPVFYKTFIRLIGSITAFVGFIIIPAGVAIYGKNDRAFFSITQIIDIVAVIIRFTPTVTTSVIAM